MAMAMPFAILLTLLFFVPSLVLGCTNYIVSSGASHDNSTQIAYNSDGFSLYGSMKHLPAGKHKPGTMREVYDWTSGIYMGSIPEALETYNVVGNTNEYQVTIAETTFDGLESLAEPYPGSIIDYYSLMWIVLQRVKTAREAVIMMGDLTQKYGYASTGESFSISDKNEVWIMEMIGKGKTEKGSIWVARKIPEGAVCGHANQARITTWPRDDPENNIYAPDVVSFARRHNLWSDEKSDEEFSFSDVFDPITPVGARACELRVWNFFRLALGGEEGEAFAKKHLSYVKGIDLRERMPLWVHVNSVSLNTTMWAMRSRYRDTFFDQRSDIGAGPFHSEIRTRPEEFKVGNVTYAFERNVGYQGTFFNFVAQGRKWLPDYIGGLTWFGVDDPTHSPRVPMYSSSNRVPKTYREGNGDSGHFVLRSAFWIHNVVANFVYSRYDLLAPVVEEKIISVEREYFEQVKKVDARALEMVRSNQHSVEDVKEMLTLFSEETADRHVDNWIILWQNLMVKYRDGLVISPGGKKKNPKDHATPVDAETKGYSKDWYERIAKETGDHYIVPTHPKRKDVLLIHQKRKIDLLKRK
eukprot:g665.t1